MLTSHTAQSYWSHDPETGCVLAGPFTTEVEARADAERREHALQEMMARDYQAEQDQRYFRYEI